MRYTNIELERNLLGAFLLSPFVFRQHRRCLSARLFSDPKTRLLCELFGELHDKGVGVGEKTVTAALRDKGVDVAGYMTTLNDLKTACGITSNEVPGVAAQLDELRRAREAFSVTGAVHGYDVPPAGEFISAIQRAARIVQGGGGGQDATIREVCNEVMATMTTANEKGGALLGASTGFPALDAMTMGLRGKSLWILAGRTAHGKTSVALQIGDGVVRNGGRALFVSLEMPRDELVTRLVSQRTGIDGRKVQRAELSGDAEWRRVTAALADLSASGWCIVDRAGMNIDQIEAAILAAHEDAPLSLAVIDYAQLVRHDAKEPRYRALGRVAETLYGLAKELDVPVILCSQLSRGVEDSPDRRPRLSDLRESGDLEQSASFVLFVHRPALLGANVPKSETELILRKNRFGPTGTIHAIMTPETTTFRETTSPTRGEDEQRD